VRVSAHDLDRRDSLAALLGGRRGAIDATLPPAAFGVGWLISGHSIGIGVVSALVVGAIVAAWRWRRGTRPRAVLIGLLGVCVAGLIAIYTGRAEDFFLLQILSNGASALAWLISIVVRRPFLGLIAGAALGQKTRWRQDPALVRAYGRASVVWIFQYVLRLVVFLPLWWAGQVAWLTVARVAMTWPLIVACLAISWWVLRKSLPPGHPGIRHPQVD